MRTWYVTSENPRGVDAWLAAPDGPGPGGAARDVHGHRAAVERGPARIPLGPYPQPPPGQVEVNFKATLICEWKASPVPLEEDEEKNWIAISFDQFTPPERASADYLAQLQACTVETCVQFGV